MKCLFQEYILSDEVRSNKLIEPSWPLNRRSLLQFIELVQKYNWKLVGKIEKTTEGHCLILKNDRSKLLILFSEQLSPKVPNEFFQTYGHLPIIVIFAGEIPIAWLKHNYTFIHLNEFEPNFLVGY